MSDNMSIKEKIAVLEKQREGMSHGSFDYARITADMQVLAEQLQAEPPPSSSDKSYWKALVVGGLGPVLVGVVTGLILYLVFKIK